MLNVRDINERVLSTKYLVLSFLDFITLEERFCSLRLVCRNWTTWIEEHRVEYSPAQEILEDINPPSYEFL